MAKRFFIAVREQGPREALRKARLYGGMIWRGEGVSAVPQQHSGMDHASPETYLHGIWQQLAQGNAFHPERDIDEREPFIAIIGDLNLQQCRKYRVEQLAEFWRSQGIACDYAHYQDLPRTVRLMTRATHLIEYRLQSNPMTEMLRYEARRLKLPILYDIDDPLFSIAAYETYGNMAALDPAFKPHFLAEAPKYLSMMNGADIVTVSTPDLAEHTRQLTDRPVHVRRNFADDITLADGAQARADAALQEQDDVFRVVFASGSQGHEVDFVTIAPMLDDFLAGADNRRLLLLGHFNTDHLSEAMKAKTDVVPFTTYDNYLIALAKCDCAVMPLEDDLFNRCKSAVRVIDAASVGVPAIVPTVGDLRNVVIDGETGFIAQTPQDWHDALTRLAGEPGLARKMGDAARVDLETRWVGRPEDHIISREILDWIAT